MLKCQIANSNVLVPYSRLQQLAYRLGMELG